MWRLNLSSCYNASRRDLIILRVASWINNHEGYQTLLRDTNPDIIENLHFLDIALDVDRFTMTHITGTMLFIVDVLIQQGKITSLNYADWFHPDRPVIRRLVDQLENVNSHKATCLTT